MNKRLLMWQGRLGLAARAMAPLPHHVLQLPHLQLGSGVRKMFKYGKPFAGSDPSLMEGDIFRSELSLDSDLFRVNGESDVPINVPINETIKGKVREVISLSPGINRERLAHQLNVDVKTIGRAIAALSEVVEHRGSKKTGGYFIKGE